MNFGELQVEAFVDNLTDSHTITNYNWSIDPGRQAPAACSATSPSARAPSA